MQKQFKGLNTLRAIAALVVVFGHIELIKSYNSIPNLIDSNSPIFPDGHTAVILFFVLSGFLISYLLLKEKQNFGKIHFKKFYLRRILRIWPLYYLTILLSYIIVEANYSVKSIILCLTIFPNVAHSFLEGWSSSPQIWSIGVEEQFYLFWPIILFYIPKKKLLTFLILFFLGYSILPHLISYINIRTINDVENIKIIERFFFHTKFNCMALGSIIGYFYAYNQKCIQNLISKRTFTIITLLILVLWLGRFSLNYFNDEFFALFFSLIIIGVTSNEKLNIDSKLSIFLGKISYGLYMYHWIIIVLTIKFLPTFENLILYNFSLYIIVILSTILISTLSFFSFENFFLKLKKKFSV